MLFICFIFIIYIGECNGEVTSKYLYQSCIGFWSEKEKKKSDKKFC